MINEFKWVVVLLKVIKQWNQKCRATITYFEYRCTKDKRNVYVNIYIGPVYNTQ